MEKHIMLAFVSTVNPNYMKNPVPYSDIQGKSYDAIQTNESAIVYVERMLEAKGDSLSKIFLIASSAVNTEKAPVPNEFGEVTHLEFLKLRVAKEFPQLADKFSEHDYLEKGDDVEVLLNKNISQTAAIADAVTDFAKKNPDDKIKVHADMTGGFRHTSMLMLSIIQLLKYRGMETGEILYSDLDLEGKPPKPKSPKVYPVNKIHHMFSLITGADEFVRFGSVEMLNEYFGKNPLPAVKSLLEAMNRFSDAIKICRTSKIEDELKDLGQHIKTFREHPDKDLRSELFAKIIDTVEREYGNLISGQASRIEIIRWCMKKGFWQQAMTLCTEWLPEEFITRKICAPKDPGIEDTCKSKGKAAHKTWQQYFIIDYEPPGKATENKTFCSNVRKALNSENRKFSIALVPELKNFWDEYESGRRAFESCKRQGAVIPKFKEKFPKLAAVLQMLFDNQKSKPTCKGNFRAFLQKLDYNKIPNDVASPQMSNKKICELFKSEVEQPAPEEKSENKWEKREQDYRKLFDAKIIDLQPDAETALKYLNYYFDIRRERNQINHAAQHSTKSIEELSTLINACLAALKEMPAS